VLKSKLSWKFLFLTNNNGISGAGLIFSKIMIEMSNPDAAIPIKMPKASLKLTLGLIVISKEGFKKRVT
jgi:hypothetical protein